MVLTKTPICNFGEKANSFKLKGTDGKIHKIEDHLGKNGTLIMFICNHCPYVKAVIEDIVHDCKDLEKDGFGIHPAYWFLVAEKKNQIIGLSFYWIRYSTWKGKFLFLEDFVIKKEFRNKGIGSKLFESTIKICQDLKLNGMIWQVLDWNSPAINFYKKYNANISNSWLNGKLSREQITEICTNL